MGYSNVMTFKGGIPAWIKSGYALDTSASLGKTKIPTVNAGNLEAKLGSVQVLDIRSPSLYAMGSIPGSIQIPMGRLSEEYAQLSNDTPTVVVDHAGKQVLAASRFLVSKGFTDVKRLQGGLMNWAANGKPLTK